MLTVLLHCLPQFSPKKSSKYDHFEFQSSIQFISYSWFFCQNTLENLTCCMLLIFMSFLVAPDSKWTMPCNLHNQLFLYSCLVQPCCRCRPEGVIGEVACQTSLLCHVFYYVPQFVDSYWCIHKPGIFCKYRSWSQVECRWFSVHWHMTMILVEHGDRASHPVSSI